MMSEMNKELGSELEKKLDDKIRNSLREGFSHLLNEMRKIQLGAKDS